MSTVNCISLPVEPQDDLRKRLFDVVISGLVLCAALPVMLVVGMLVRVSSKGPVFFRQQRVGRGGRLFMLYKFRTMRVDGGGPAVTAGSDARITPVGRFLRRSKLDELPQFLHVLLGDMSVVGPRPEVPEYVEHYTDEQRRVLCVRPGITGVSQLEFRNEEALLAGRPDVEEYYLQEVMPAKLRLDLHYVRHQSLVGDLILLWRTIFAILLPRSSNGPRPTV
jgi:lipopolysaccharide/colanic/teichoic acid biosynthesis glycosyltransferase